MINIYNNNTKIFFELFNIFNVKNEKNLEKISNLYTEVYGSIFSEQSLENILIQSISEIINYDKYTFINKSNNEIVNIFDICIEKKNINNGPELEYNGIIYSYYDNIQLGKQLQNYKIYNNSNNQELTLNEKIALIFELGQFIQNNLFLHLFRSFFVNSNGDIISAFHLRFFNLHELYIMAAKNEFWGDVIKYKETREKILMEKIDGQLLMVYNYKGKTLLQSKGSVILLDNILSNNFDKNGLFGNLYNLFRNNNDNIQLLDNLGINNPDIIYHFEFLHNTNPVIQKYDMPGIFLLGGRNKDNFLSVLDTYRGINIFKHDYELLYNTIIKSIGYNKLINKIIIDDNEKDIIYNIKKIRGGDLDDLDNYIIEGYILAEGYIYQKIKNTQYFVAKLMKSFSLSNIEDTLSALKGCIIYDKKELFSITSEIINSGNIKDAMYVNEMLDKIKGLKTNRKLKISYIRFLNYLIYNKDKSAIDNILNFILNNKKMFFYEYKKFLVNSFLYVSTSMLTSDTEEISELHTILGVKQSELDLTSNSLEKDVEKIILYKLENGRYESYSFFIKKISDLINDIYDIEIDI